jgi:hypothetical protein
MAPAIRRKRAAYISLILDEVSLRVSPDVPLVALLGLNQLSLRHR